MFNLDDFRSDDAFLILSDMEGVSGIIDDRLLSGSFWKCYGRYLLIIKRVAEEPASWSMIKRYVEAVDKPISDSNLALLIRNLVDNGFLAKIDNKYKIEDPILTYAVRSREIKL